DEAERAKILVLSAHDVGEIARNRTRAGELIQIDVIAGRSRHARRHRETAGAEDEFTKLVAALARFAPSVGPADAGRAAGHCAAFEVIESFVGNRTSPACCRQEK